jgi:NAD(P)-dependent dehydrogenase (short-subunit alcohol dehydrogenase family)
VCCQRTVLSLLPAGWLDRAMRTLFIGGTRFVGRAMAEAAVAAGHDITLLHRGQHASELFPDPRFIDDHPRVVSRDPIVIHAHPIVVDDDEGRRLRLAKFAATQAEKKARMSVNKDRIAANKDRMGG